MWFSIDEDIVQRIKVAGIFVIQSYKIITGTMMSLFIPQSCGDQICMLQENYENSNVIIKLCFTGIISMLSFLDIILLSYGEKNGL